MCIIGMGAAASGQSVRHWGRVPGLKTGVWSLKRRAEKSFYIWASPCMSGAVLRHWREVCGLRSEV